MKNYYQVYGLTFCSDLLCPGLVMVNGDQCLPDIHIRVGNIHGCPLTLEEGKGFAADTEHALFFIRDIGYFVVNRGREIIFQPVKGCDLAAVQLYLWGSVVGALLYQRGLLLIHGNAVSVSEQRECVIFTGPSGAGKSTLAYACYRQGMPILTDDVCAIYFDQHGHPMVIPAGLPLKLWRDVTDFHGYDASTLMAVANRMTKYHVAKPEVFTSGPRRLRRMYLLESNDMDEIRTRSVSGAEKYTIVHTNTYRLGFLNKMGLASQHFTACTKLAKHIEVETLFRPLREDYGASVALWLEEQFENTMMI